jgi:hypothetical protein
MLDTKYRLNANETIFVVETTRGFDIWADYYYDAEDAITEAKKYWQRCTNEERKRGANACVLAVTVNSLDASIANDEDDIGTLGTYHPDLCDHLYIARKDEHWNEMTGKLLPDIEYTVIEVTDDGLTYAINVYADLDEANEEAEWHFENEAAPGSRVYVRAEHWRDGEIACDGFDKEVQR